MDFFRLFFREPALIGFGLLFCFGSSVGQTFFVSLFVPSWSESFGLSEAVFANIYGGITLASAAALPFIGRVIDRTDLVVYSAGVCVFLSLGCFLIAGAWSLIPLTIGMAFVRLGGQGLMSHVALTSIARFFHGDRGKALALTTLGFPLGEIALPAAAVFAIGAIGWRATYSISGAAVALILPAAILLILRRADFRRAAPADASAADDGPPPRVFRTTYFYMIAPLFMAGPLLITALIFHQGLIAEAKGMTLQIFAVAFAVFAVCQVAGSLASGPLIDRFTAHRLFPLHLIPFALGPLALIGSASLPAVLIYMALAGATAGLGGTIRNAIVAELVRPERLGAARSSLTALMVVSTALGPALFGWMMLAGVTVDGLLWFTIVALVIISVLGALAEYPSFVRRPEPARTETLVP